MFESTINICKSPTNFSLDLPILVEFDTQKWSNGFWDLLQLTYYLKKYLKSVISLCLMVFRYIYCSTKIEAIVKMPEHYTYQMLNQARLGKLCCCACPRRRCRGSLRLWELKQKQEDPSRQNGCSKHISGVVLKRQCTVIRETTRFRFR